MKAIQQIHFSQFSEDATNLIVKSDYIAPPTFPLHNHDYFEIELVTSGHGYQMINGKKYPMKPGMFYILAPSDNHKFFIQKNITVWNISFTHSFLPENFSYAFAQKKEDLIFFLDEEELNFVSQIFINAQKEHIHKPKLSDVLLNQSLSLLLTIIMRKGDLLIEREQQNAPILDAISYVKLHYTQNPSRELVAQHCHLNASYLSSAFKNVTGKTFSDYLIDLKISHAKKLLRHTSESIMLIAQNSGFESICNFNRTFKKKTQLSPSEYRKKHQMPPSFTITDT
jgi:AraC-like DNA-binding protein